MKGMIAIFHYRYEITRQQVTMHHPYRLTTSIIVSLCVSGTVGLCLALFSFRGLGTPLALGGGFALLAAFLLAMTSPWGPPRIVITPTGIRWGTRWIERAAVVSVSAQRTRSTRLRAESGETNLLYIELAEGDPLRIWLGDATLRDLEVLQNGIRLVLGIGT